MRIPYKIEEWFGVSMSYQIAMNTPQTLLVKLIFLPNLDISS